MTFVYVWKFITKLTGNSEHCSYMWEICLKPELRRFRQDQVWFQRDNDTREKTRIILEEIFLGPPYMTRLFSCFDGSRFCPMEVCEGKNIRNATPYNTTDDDIPLTQLPSQLLGSCEWRIEIEEIIKVDNNIAMYILITGEDKLSEANINQCNTNEEKED
ncbi:hypothetical protein FQA39_LY02467 [Lamprigera yunnana]|nr:hypothetical protein FQA39_LY02467 [Lamprigera yunnana]